MTYLWLIDFRLAGILSGIVLYLIHSASSSDDLHTTQILESDLHGSMITQWLRGDQHVCKSYSQEDIKETTEENLEWKTIQT